MNEAKTEAKATVKKQTKAKAKAYRVAKNKKMRKAGFERTRAGYMFPGTDQEEVEKATKLRMVEKETPEKKKEKPLSMKIKPIDKRGDINVNFN